MEVIQQVTQKTYKQGDPEMPAEFKEMLVKLLLKTKKIH